LKKLKKKTPLKDLKRSKNKHHQKMKKKKNSRVRRDLAVFGGVTRFCGSVLWTTNRKGNVNS